MAARFARFALRFPVPRRDKLAAFLGVLLLTSPWSTLRAEEAAADSIEMTESVASDYPYVTRTPEELADEQAYADAQLVALTAFSTCLNQVKGTGFLGIGQDDPAVTCATERATLARYLPEDISQQLLDDTQAKILSGSEELL